MSNLNWTRIADGEYNGRSVYEYEAIENGIRYHIYWSSNAGFGLSIAYADRNGKPDNVCKGIRWLRALYRCKEYAEKYCSQVEA